MKRQFKPDDTQFQSQFSIVWYEGLQLFAGNKDYRSSASFVVVEETTAIFNSEPIGLRAKKTKEDEN